MDDFDTRDNLWLLILALALTTGLCFCMHVFFDIKFYESTSVPKGNPTLAIAETQIFVPLTDANHSDYHKKNGLASIEIKFKEHDKRK